MPRTAAILASVVVVLLVGLGTAYIVTGRNTDRFAGCSSTSVAGGADIGGPFTLIDGEGETVTDKDVITEPALVYFGYTFCPDVCPIDVSRNAEAATLLADRGISVTPVFISIDPARDTPEVVADYAANMHERMIGLTGSPEQVKAASQAYKTYYNAHEDPDDPFYLVDHSTFTYLVLPEEGTVEFFRREQSPEEMADTVACYVNAL